MLLEKGVTWQLWEKNNYDGTTVGHFFGSVVLNHVRMIKCYGKQEKVVMEI